MTIHVLVEGPSERALIERWGPRLLPSQTWRVHPHQGKGRLPRNLNAPPAAKARGLLDQLPAKLRGFAGSLDPTKDAVLVLVDADEDPPDKLQVQLQRVLAACAPELKVEARVAVEETEAFYLGDLKALAKVYPDADLTRARAYAPDSICGTWELFGQIIGDGGGNKVTWAENMGPHLTVRRALSRSPSFQGLIGALLRLVPIPKASKRKRHRHLSRKNKAPRRRH